MEKQLKQKLIQQNLKDINLSTGYNIVDGSARN